MEKDSQGSKQPSIGKASGIVGIMTLSSRVLGLARDTAIATVFGAGAATDAFFVAFKVGNLLRRLVAEGSLAIAFVPVFTEELAVSKERAAAALRSVATAVLLLTLLLSGLGMLYAEPLTSLFAPGFAHDSAKLNLAASLMRLLFPYVVLVSLLALVNSALNALGYFAFPAMAPALLNVAMLCGALFFRDYFDPPVFVLAWSVLAGGVLALLPQLYILKQTGFSLMPTAGFAVKPLKRLGLMMIPAVVSASLYQLMAFINTLLASLLPEGSVSWLYYADRLFQFPLGVFSLAIATAILPALSRSSANNDESAFKLQLRETLCWVSYITIPAACGLLLLADPIISVIYQRGSFTPDYAAKTASALRAYALGLWAISCHSVIVRAYLAKRRTGLPAMVSAAAIATNITMALALMGPVHAAPATWLGQTIAAAQSKIGIASLAHAGLALSGSIASVTSCLLLWLFLGSIRSRVPVKELLPSLSRSAAGAAAMVVFLKLLLITSLPDFGLLLLGIPGGGLCFLGVSLALGSKEAQSIYALLEKLFRKHPRLPI